MALSEGLRDMMTQTVAHAASGSRDAYGKPTYQAPVPRECYIEYRQQYIRNAQGAEVLSRATLYFPGTLAIGLQDALTMPDGTQPQIQAIETWPDTQTGDTHHVRVFV